MAEKTTTEIQSESDVKISNFKHNSFVIRFKELITKLHVYPFCDPKVKISNELKEELDSVVDRVARLSPEVGILKLRVMELERVIEEIRPCTDHLLPKDRFPLYAAYLRGKEAPDA